MKNTYDKIMDSILYIVMVGLIVVSVMTVACFFTGCGFPAKHICNSKCSPKAQKATQSAINIERCQTW